MPEHPIKRLGAAVFLSLLTSATIVLISRSTLLSATRWGWMVFFFYLIAEWAYSKQGKKAALRFRAQYGDEPLMSYILVPLCFAILGFAFWLGINKIYALAGTAEERAEGSVSIGMLAFERTDIVVRQREGSTIGTVQPGIVFHNISPVLLKYEVKSFATSAAGKSAGDNYDNRGGLIYAGRESSFYSPTIEVDLSQPAPITGIIEYEIAYGSANEDFIHTTKKKVRYDLYVDAKNHTHQSRFTILNEEEK